MSEPWVTMSPSFTRAHGAGASHFHGGRQSGMTTYGEKTDEGAYSSAHLLHPQLLQPRFPLPVLDPFSPSNAATAGSNVGSVGNAANRVPTMEEFAAIANKNGRIGIYTKEVNAAYCFYHLRKSIVHWIYFTHSFQEREFLIQRFRDKKKRRVWKKKIRYECRKDLADRRCRVKGRFVKAAPVTGKHHHANSISSDNTSEETNHSRSSSLGHHESSNNNRLVFRIPRRSNAAASAQSTSSAAHNSTKASAKKRPLKPLMLNMLSSSEDRLKYLTSILGELDPNSPTNPQDDPDDDEDHDDVDDDMDDDMDEDDDEDDTEGSDEMNTSNHHHDNVDKPEPRYRTRANSEHSLDYRRVRRHSIAY